LSARVALRWLICTPLCLILAAIQIIRELKQSAHFLTDGVEMEPGITLEFETTEFAGITEKIMDRRGNLWVKSMDSGDVEETT
jgi:hypothetical protein